MLLIHGPKLSNAERKNDYVRKLVSAILKLSCHQYMQYFTKNLSNSKIEVKKFKHLPPGVVDVSAKIRNTIDKTNKNVKYFNIL